MGLYDTVTVDVLAADSQTKQLGEDMLHYRLTEDGRLVAPCGAVVAYHGLVHLYGEDGAEFFAVFTHGRLAFVEQAQRWVRVARYLGCRSVSTWLRELADEQAKRLDELSRE